jgi:hypothetical protein
MLTPTPPTSVFNLCFIRGPAPIRQSRRNHSPTPQTSPRSFGRQLPDLPQDPWAVSDVATTDPLNGHGTREQARYSAQPSSPPLLRPKQQTTAPPPSHAISFPSSSGPVTPPEPSTNIPFPQSPSFCHPCFCPRSSLSPAIPAPTRQDERLSAFISGSPLSSPLAILTKPTGTNSLSVFRLAFIHGPSSYQQSRPPPVLPEPSCLHPPSERGGQFSY